MVQKLFNDSSGVQVVEFAFIAPLLFLLIFGIIEFGVALYDVGTVKSASRLGARTSILYVINSDGSTPAYCSCTCSDIEPVVQSYLQRVPLISLGSTPSLPSCANGGITLVPVNIASDYIGCTYKVTVSYPYQFLVFGGLLKLATGGTWNGTWNIQWSSEMRSEQQQ